MNTPIRNIFDRMEDGRHAAIEAENAIGEILGVELLGLGFDDYDNSFEIFPDSEVADVTPTDEQHAAIIALGCSRYWINFPDGTERYGRGERKAVAGGINRWQRHNDYKDQPRSEERDAARYRLLRRGQHWSVINGIGDTLRAEALDAAVDAVLESTTQSPA